MDKGKYVSRSTYQKVVEENKRLLADIKVLVTTGFGCDYEQTKAMKEVMERWEKHFQREEDLKNALSFLSAHYKSPQS